MTLPDGAEIVTYSGTVKFPPGTVFFKSRGMIYAHLENPRFGSLICETQEDLKNDRILYWAARDFGQYSFNVLYGFDTLQGMIRRMVAFNTSRCNTKERAWPEEDDELWQKFCELNPMHPIREQLGLTPS